MLTLYAIPVSLYSAKVRIVLRAKGLAWTELAPPGGYGSSAYRSLVPSGNLPALVHHGLMIADSEAIAEYLEEAFPEPPLLPRGPVDRARARERGRFHDTRLEPELRRLFPAIAPAGRDLPLMERQRVALADRLEQLGRMIAGAPELPFGLGDCGLAVSLCWLDALDPLLGLGLALPDPVRIWRDRTERVPAVATELASYRPALAAWVARTAAAA